jgi:hypothetical protein
MILRLGVLLGLVLAAGCSHEIRIEGEDRGLFLPTARLSFDVATAGPEAASGLPGGHAVEINLAGVRGIEDTQELHTSESPVVFGGETFNPAVELRHEADFRYADIGWRWRKYFGSGGFALETFAGLGFAELDLTVQSPLQRANEKLSSGGLAGGVGVVWRFRPTTSLQSRLTVFGSGDEDGITSASRWDASIVQALGRNVALRGGIGAWSVFSERANRSDVEMRFSGITLGLDVLF